MLRSPVFVVHTYAAIALDNMLTVREQNPGGSGYSLRLSKESLEPVLKDLLGGLFGVFQINGNKPNQYVIKAVMRVISRAKEKMAPMLQLVRENLSSLLRNVIANPQSPVYNHYLFECLGALIACAAAAGGPKVCCHKAKPNYL
jgi:exportin-2 (importin alpha re-exporter)